MTGCWRSARLRACSLSKDASSRSWVGTRLSEPRHGKSRCQYRTLIERATRILAEHKTSQYFGYLALDGSLSFWLERPHYRRQRRHDGVFILQTNHARLRAEEIVQAYMQLQEVERAFRVLKSLIKVRPIFHWAERRVETHIFICFLAYLLVKTLELRLRAAGLQITAARALGQLSRLQAIEHTWEDQAIVVQANTPDRDLQAILDALGIRLTNPVLRVAAAPAA